MSNPNAPFGLRPVNALSGQPYTGAVRTYSVPSGDGTAIFIGDAVKLVGTGQIINGSPYTDVARAASGDVICGVVIGVMQDTRDSLIYRAASTQRRLLVADDPNLVFEIQQTSTGTALNVNDIGFNTNLTVVAGSTVTGYSGSIASNSAGNTTNTLDLKIVGIVDRPDNDIGSSASSGTLASRLQVRINRHQYSDQVAGV
jgi:microcompartment protein CcmK/EutM